MRVRLFAALLALQAVRPTAEADPFAFFKPSVMLNEDDRRRLDRGEPLARVLPAGDREVAVFAAVAVDVSGDRLVEWVRRIELFKKSSYVLAIGRFSNPPNVRDLATLVLDDEELEEIRRCRPGDCALKLAGSEMSELKNRATQAGPNWKPALQEEFRRIVLNRVVAYRASGSSGLLPYEDHRDRVWPAARFALLLRHSPFLTEQVPEFVEHLNRSPDAAASGVESFIYWSKERFGNKPVVSATQVSILRGNDGRRPDALVAGKGIFATHYLDASLGLTAILPGAPGKAGYLVHVNRSDVDVLGGVFGGLVRWTLQRRLKAEAADVLQGLRRRLVSGPPEATEPRGIR